MSDLLGSLISSSPQAAIQPAEPRSAIHAAAHPGGIVVHDVEAYLSSSKGQSLMASTTSPQPVQLGGAKTNHHVTILYQLCQSRGLVPQFEIEAQPNGGFGGWLQVGNETIFSSEGWLNKKEAKEALAEKGLELVKGMGDKKNGKGVAAEGEPKNWIGLLLRASERPFSCKILHAGKLKYFTEYHNSLGSEAGGAGANFIEYALGSSFACTCTIPFHDTVFGSSTTPFATKKAARANAAKEAVQFLIAHGLTNPDGSVKTRKKGSPGKSVTVEGKALEVKMDATYAQKVNGVSTTFSPSFLPRFYHLHLQIQTSGSHDFQLALIY